MKSLILALLAGLFLTSAATADEMNKKCPVSGKDVDTSVTAKTSVTVGFCCSKCQAKFEGDQKAKDKALKKYAGSTDSPANKKCEMNSSKDVAEGNTATVEKEVAFCCEKCKAAFEKDPKKYIGKVVK